MEFSICGIILVPKSFRFWNILNFGLVHAQIWPQNYLMLWIGAKSVCNSKLMPYLSMDISHLPITITKYLKQLTQKTCIQFIVLEVLVHDGITPCVGLLVGVLRRSWECVVERSYFVGHEAKTKRGRDQGPTVPVKGAPLQTLPVPALLPNTPTAFHSMCGLRACNTWGFAQMCSIQCNSVKRFCSNTGKKGMTINRILQLFICSFTSQFQKKVLP